MQSLNFSHYPKPQTRPDYRGILLFGGSVSGGAAMLLKSYLSPGDD